MTTNHVFIDADILLKKCNTPLGVMLLPVFTPLHDGCNYCSFGSTPIYFKALDVYYFADISSHLAIYGVTTGQQQLQH